MTNVARFPSMRVRESDSPFIMDELRREILRPLMEGTELTVREAVAELERRYPVADDGARG